MNAQIIEKGGKKEFAVIPYKDFLAMNRSLENYRDLQAFRRAKSDYKNLKGRPFAAAAKELGLLR